MTFSETAPKKQPPNSKAELPETERVCELLAREYRNVLVAETSAIAELQSLVLKTLTNSGEINISALVELTILQIQKLQAPDFKDSIHDHIGNAQSVSNSLDQNGPLLNSNRLYVKLFLDNTSTFSEINSCDKIEYSTFKEYFTKFVISNRIIKSTSDLTERHDENLIKRDTTVTRRDEIEEIILGKKQLREFLIFLFNHIFKKFEDATIIPYEAVTMVDNTHAFNTINNSLEPYFKFTDVLIKYLKNIKKIEMPLGALQKFKKTLI